MFCSVHPLHTCYIKISCSAQLSSWNHYEQHVPWQGRCHTFLNLLYYSIWSAAQFDCLFWNGNTLRQQIGFLLCFLFPLFFSTTRASESDGHCHDYGEIYNLSDLPLIIRIELLATVFMYISIVWQFYNNLLRYLSRFNVAWTRTKNYCILYSSIL